MEDFWIWIGADVPDGVRAWLYPALLCLPQVLPVEVLGRACIRSSLIFRDALRKLGHRASVEVCDLLVEHDGQLQRVGVAEDGKAVPEGFWNGHLVCVVDGVLVDTTVWQSRAAGAGLVPAAAAVRRTPLTPVPEARFGPGLSLRWYFGARNRSWMHTRDAAPTTRRELVEALAARIAAAAPADPPGVPPRALLTRAIRSTGTLVPPIRQSGRG